ncbi:DNA-binding transcriptional response regulator, NtrC family, contains REC, AAA-type ATPase, and a Fis-type DNA-binding domains [Malonomonas rubra DSM 5091]|uniref:DNA-binding transcriptional response regulator, NtrC family, contains REC, AAA-type ATPase, and a Fis-type DNA-binding domains n=1 Tax=Malonomonas rubra DSM 5091 TaxID=1122189 RepID=A0A1M6ESY9_MALRU|nr:sigma-54 dependent transcriptional regulator [Malonomonas rubra]SHI88523.1 DNA-binding transcriptional response regulator, NtrC family, contains REC, AAA-type ATPase, and a Fis-type DNA-binding domains [Malonomonas rubra DSM 5091]
MTDSQDNTPTLLLVDDEAAWLHGMRLTLARIGLTRVEQCLDSREVMGILQRQKIDLILLDLTMPYLTGDELLPLISAEYPEIPVIVLTGLNQLEIAVECMRLGAFDFFVKSVEAERLTLGIRRALRMQEALRENQRIKTSLIHDELEHPGAFSEIITQNKQMSTLLKYVEAVSGSKQPILISGESGVGKELIARAIARLYNPDAPYVAVNVAGLDDNMFSDTLFGHCKGAFTGADKDRPGMIEQAGAGVLFLDEIGDMTPSSQVKLLRLLQEGEYFPLGSDRPKRSQARIVVATNRNLEQMQHAGEFRKDLYYRLKTHQIELPPLRNRRDDIPLLLDHFLRLSAAELGKKVPTPPPELEVLLSTYHFPGNVRELAGMVYDAVSRHQTGKLSQSSFKQAIGSHPLKGIKAEDRTSTGESLLSFHQELPTLAEAANLLVEEAMKRAQNNQTIAAQLLGISRPALSKRLKKLREEDSRTQ